MVWSQIKLVSGFAFIFLPPPMLRTGPTPPKERKAMALCLVLRAENGHVKKIYAVRRCSTLHVTRSSYSAKQSPDFGRSVMKKSRVAPAGLESTV